MTKINNIIFIAFALAAIICWGFLLSSCSSSGGRTVPEAPPAAPEVKREQESVADAAKTIGEVGKDVGSRADKIDTHASVIEKNTPPEAKTTLQPEVDGIKIETKGLREDSATLSATEQKLKDTESRLADQQENIETYIAYTKESEIKNAALIDKIKELESSNAKLLKTMLSWITVICVVGVGISLVIGFWFKTPAAFMIAAGCVATMGVSIAVTIYLQQIAWVALSCLGIGLISAAIYVFTQIKKKDKEVLAKDEAVKERDEAVKELVHTGEIAKTYLPDSAREKLFGNTVEPGVIHQVQSDTTMKLVKNIRDLEKSKRGYGLAPEISKFSRHNASAVSDQDPNRAQILTDSPKTILG